MTKPRVTSEMRKRYFGTLPRITYLPKNRSRCEGICYGRLPLYAMFSDVRPGKTEADRAAAYDRARCKKRAVFRFKKLKKSYVRSGLYCWTHMSQITTNDMAEREAAHRWSKAHPPEWSSAFDQDLRDRGIHVDESAS